MDFIYFLILSLGLYHFNLFMLSCVQFVDLRCVFILTTISCVLYRFSDDGDTAWMWVLIPFSVFLAEMRINILGVVLRKPNNSSDVYQTPT